MTNEDFQGFYQILTVRSFLQSQLECVDRIISEWVSVAEENESEESFPATPLEGE